MSNRTRLIYILSALMIAWGMVSSCSTRKARWTNITYHNTTAHYNVWWNGNESLKAGIGKLESASNDDYTRILMPYSTANKEKAMSVYPEMDRAIEKGIKGIKKHSIIVRGKEHVHYVRKCYLLTAQACFYKQDYVTAANTCQVMMTQYAGTEEGDAAAILKARCASAEKRYNEAESELDALVVALGKGGFERSLAPDLYMAMIEALIPQEKYKKTVQFAKLVLDSSVRRKDKARVCFILGQIYQQANKKAVATTYYEQALKKTSEYTMEFNARLNIAACADLEHTDLQKMERQLDKMLRDHKNDEFHDQIFFAKGEMYMGMKDAKKACDNYALAVSAAKDHPNQRAKAALRMAEVQYEVYENYDLAQRYYDTAIAVIGSDYPHYRQIRERYDILTSLARYTRQVERNDSLIAFSMLPVAERDSLINSRIERLKAEEEAARERELIQQASAANAAASNTLQGNWYFYNNNTVQQGSQTFKQRWGSRVLEDYWFISHRGPLGVGSLIAGMDEELTDDDDSEYEDADTTVDSSKKDITGDPNDPHQIAYYLKDLPTTEHQRDSMHYETAISLLNAGYIFHFGLNNTPRAVEYYLRMTTDYPDRDEVAQAFYMLYRIYTQIGNTPSADYYRNMVLMGFPDSDYANLIRDENYYQQLLQRDQILADRYDEIYETYRKGRYRSVVAQSRNMTETYGKDARVARFQFFEALALVRMDSTHQAISLLEHIVATHNASDSIVTYAQSLLQYLNDEGPTIAQSTKESHFADPTEMDNVAEKAAKINKATTSESAGNQEEEQLSTEAQLFRFKEDMQHYVVVLLYDRNIRATELQYQMANFNVKYYSNKGYRVNPLLFTDTVQMLTIHRFMNATEALNYSIHLKQEESPLSKLNATSYRVFPISTQNYATFYNRKMVDAYDEFFEKYYITK